MTPELAIPPVALMYHDLVDEGAEDASGFPGRDAALYKVSPSLFDQHLAAIAAATAAPPGHPAAPARPNGFVLNSPPGPAFTFDDGGASASRAADALERAGRRGFFFITANYIGTPGFVDGPTLRDLHARGHVVGSHSCSHPLRIGHCTPERLLDEWSRSCETIGAILGVPVRIASVPGGDFAPAVAEAAAQAGVADLFTSEPDIGAQQAFGLTLHGRFTIRRSTSAATAASLAAGEWLPTRRQALVWNAKKVTKRLGGEQYLRLRRLLIRHGDEVAWGDR